MHYELLYIIPLKYTDEENNNIIKEVEDLLISHSAKIIKSVKLFYIWPGSQVVRQGSAKPLSAVRFRSRPPVFASSKLGLARPNQSS